MRRWAVVMSGKEGSGVLGVGNCNWSLGECSGEEVECM